MTQEMMMISPQEYDKLLQHYKGTITQSDALNKAARVAVKKHLLLEDQTLTPSQKVARIKPLSKELQKWTRRVRHVPLSSASKLEENEEEDNSADEALNAPLENLLKKVLKQSPVIQRTPLAVRRLRPTRDWTEWDKQRRRSPFVFQPNKPDEEEEETGSKRKRPKTRAAVREQARHETPKKSTPQKKTKRTRLETIFGYTPDEQGNLGGEGDYDDV